MVTKTFICDKCKKSVGETELYSVEVELNRPTGGYSSRMHSAHKDICKECLKTLGIIVDAPEDAKEREKQTSKNQKTFENRICNFLSDLGVLFEE
ncbi:MAG TPA: hypothetical protein VHR42_04090 [Clostridia bacterium]|nr:hypothetical protein [Clostridia bacterium]